MERDYYVVVYEGGEWAVRRKNSLRASKIARRKCDAINYGKAFAEKNRLSLVVFNVDGSQYSEHDFTE